MRRDATVFLVDDDPAVRDSLKLLLETYGFTVRDFASGSEFLASGERAETGCLVLDMHMPVALGEVGSGVADAVAAGSEGVRDLIDRGAETPREEAPPGIVQPRLGFAPALIDHKSVRLDHRVAHGLGGLGKLGEGTP